MTRTGQHVLYLRRDGAGSAELRDLDLGRSVDTLVVRRTEVDLLAPPARLETPLGAGDDVDWQTRTRCATDALGEHAVVHLVAGELLRVTLATDTTERFAYDTESGPLSTLSISADARAILFTQPSGGARYLDTTTGSTLRVLENSAEPAVLYGHCVFRPYTGIHYPAGVFQCQNSLNGGSTYVLRDGVFWRSAVRAHRSGTSFFVSAAEGGRLVDLRTGAATPLGAAWIGTEYQFPRVVSESPLRVLWFDSYAPSNTGELVTPSGRVSLPNIGRIRVAGPTSALGHTDGANGSTIVAFDYGGAAPPTARTVAELPARTVGDFASLEPDDKDPSTVLVSAQCMAGASCSRERLLVRATGEVERVDRPVEVRYPPRAGRLAIVTYADSDAQPAPHNVGILDARLRPHRLFAIATRTSTRFEPLDIHQVSTPLDAKALVVDDAGCLRSTDLESRATVELEALVRTRHGLGPCEVPAAFPSARATVVAQGPGARAVGLLFPQQGNGEYRVVFVEP